MLGAKLGVSEYLSVVCREIEKLDPAQIEKVSELVETAYDEGRFVFIIGNGGSAPTPRTSAKISPSARSATSRTRSGSRSSA